MTLQEYKRQWRLEKLEDPTWAAQERLRCREKARRKQAQDPETLLAATRRWRERNPDCTNKLTPARLARIVLGNAVRDGRVAKSECCERCGSRPSRRRMHGHHHDYNQPLEVEWLCSVCHGKTHLIEIPDIS